MLETVKLGSFSVLFSHGNQRLISSDSAEIAQIDAENNPT